MACRGLSFVKILIKSSLDNYVLPGTLTGTEILLLYMIHWKRNCQLFVLGVLRLIHTELDVEENPTGTEALSECTVACVDATEMTQNAL